MSWQDLLEFIRARDPRLLGRVRGVPVEEIRRCEQRASIVLPTMYVDFLTTMGADAGPLHPFGAHQDSDFYALLEALPAEHYPGQQYFKVASSDDPSAISPPDTFLDLFRSDGDDAPLVWFEDGGGFSPEVVVEVGLTLAEQLSVRAFEVFAVDRRGQRGVLRMVFDSLREQRDEQRRLLELIERTGFVHALPSLPRVACLERGALSALVEVSEEAQGISVRLGADDPRALKVLREQIRERFPGVVEG